MRSPMYGRTGFLPYNSSIAFSSYKTGIVELKGGVNENVSSLELLGGELLDCKNYMLAEGGYGGYVSTEGFEALDGITLPSQYTSIVLTITDSTLGVVEGQVITGTSGATAESLETVDPVDGTMIVEALLLNEGFIADEIVSTVSGSLGTLSYHRHITGATSDYHLALLRAREGVVEVPGEGPVLGVHIFEEKMYAFRKIAEQDFIGFYVESETTGWELLDSGMTYTGSHEFYFTNYNFYASDPDYGTTAGVYSMYWCDGANKARMYDGSAVTIIDNYGMDPDDAPTRIIAHNYHLWLAYRKGSLQHSQLGYPLVWDGVLGAREIGIGAEITNLIIGVQSSLIVTQEDGISVISGNIIDDFVLEVYSRDSGGLPRTTKRMLGTIFFLDDRGLTTLDAVQNYGDYGANSISQKFKQTLLSPTHDITCTATSRALNQYRVFFDDKTAIYVSFEGQELLGATFMEFDRTVCNVAQGDVDGKNVSIFTTVNSTEDGAEDIEGYVYKLDSGRSFDGTPIVCRMATAYYHYGSPRMWKAFKKATLEVSGDSGQEFSIKVNFDYSELGNPRTIWYTSELYSTLTSSTYSVNEWGTMIYGASTAVNRTPVYLQGIGTNVSYRVVSMETYRPQHIIQNIITDYELLSRRV